MIGKLNPRSLILVALISLVIMLGFTLRARADLAVSEANLNSKGDSYEINRDAAGRLWISDYSASEAWGVDPTTGAYEIYPVSGSPIDARQAGGYLWWADGLSNVLGRVSTINGDFSEWQVPDAFGFLGTNLDDEGRLYATDSSNPYLYRLNPDLAELCTYSLPGFGASNYIVRDAGYLWLGDWFDGFLLRLQISNNDLTWWTLPEGSHPFGIAVDGQGNLWFVDQGTIVLAQLNPTTNLLTSYALPSGYEPQMVAVQSGFIWYTEQSLPSIGRLDPLTASHTTLPLTPNLEQLIPSCTDSSPSSTGKVTISTGDLSWADTSYSTFVNANGLRIYEMPAESLPWGITLSELGYVVDTGRQKLVRFSPTITTSLVVIKHVINDNGGSAVAGNFTIYVTATSPSQSSFPGAESPGTEVTINTGTYSVTETGPSGYTASYSADCTGSITAGQTKTCIITNDDIAQGQIYLPIIIR